MQYCLRHWLLMKEFLQDRLNIILCIVFVLIFAFLVNVKYLLLGSMNLSENSLDKNREIGIILMDTGHISEFETWFEQDWKDSI